jgi:hypothetical protein
MTDNRVIVMKLTSGPLPDCCVVLATYARGGLPAQIVVRSIDELARVAADHSYPREQIVTAPGATEKLRELEETAGGVGPLWEGAEKWLLENPPAE